MGRGLWSEGRRSVTDRGHAYPRPSALLASQRTAQGDDESPLYILFTPTAILQYSELTDNYTHSKHKHNRRPPPPLQEISVLHYEVKSVG